MEHATMGGRNNNIGVPIAIWLNLKIKLLNTKFKIQTVICSINNTCKLKKTV